MEQCRLSKEKCSILAYWKLSLNQLLSLFFRPPLSSELELLVSTFIGFHHIFALKTIIFLLIMSWSN